MYTSRKKIHKDNDVVPTEFEESVAQVSLFKLSRVTFDLYLSSNKYHILKEFRFRKQTKVAIKIQVIISLILLDEMNSFLCTR